MKRLLKTTILSTALVFLGVVSTKSESENFLNNSNNIENNKKSYEYISNEVSIK